MITYSLRVVPSALAVVAGIALTPSPSRASVAGDNASWINNLKCSDLVLGKKREVNPENFPKFSVWLTGFAMGVSIVPPAPDLAGYGTSMKSVLAGVLTICTLRPTKSAVDAAIDVISLEYNSIHSQGPTQMLDPLRPSE